jgi:hypothetical protein
MEQHGVCPTCYQPVGQSALAQNQAYLRVWFSETPDDPFAALEPNQRLASVPYALRAEYAANAAALEDRVVALEAGVQNIDLVALEARLAALKAKLQHITVVGDDIFIDGANLHIRNATGSTAGNVNGLGNLVIGYNEDTGPANTRTGSHNLIVGIEHTYSSFGGLVIGHTNTIGGPFASVSGGRNNRSTGFATSVSGGGGPNAVDGNLASGNYAGVSGGTLNEATGIQAWIGGGRDNTASGTESAVSGGAVNLAAGRQSSITGGQRNAANGLAATVSGGVDNTSSGAGATVSGGINRSTPGTGNWAGGSLFQEQ